MGMQCSQRNTMKYKYNVEWIDRIQIWLYQIINMWSAQKPTKTSNNIILTIRSIARSPRTDINDQKRTSTRCILVLPSPNTSARRKLNQTKKSWAANHKVTLQDCLWQRTLPPNMGSFRTCAHCASSSFFAGDHTTNHEAICHNALAEIESGPETRWR